MSLEFSVLGSGSRGNCTLLIVGCGRSRFHYLIDCGLSPRATAQRLSAHGIAPRDIAGIFLTHLDADHFYPTWCAAAERFGIPIYLHPRHRNRALHAGLTGRCITLITGILELPCGTLLEPVMLAHDALGTVGFVIEQDGLRLGYATDLGAVPETLLERFTNLHALAIESNYDRRMELASDRPDFLKRRIMSGRGHLSNDQSFAAVMEIAQHSGLSHIVALHLSQQCNDPAIVRRMYGAEAGITELASSPQRLTIAHQLHPTPLIRIHPDAPVMPKCLTRRTARQLVMF